MRKKIIKNDFNFWRYLINFWSFFFFITIILDFYTSNGLENILNIIATVYISVLTIYVSDKEFERWYDKHTSKHPGEIFVVIWSALVTSLLVLGFIFDKSYQIPGSVISSYIAVLTVLVVTLKSKQLYKIRRSRSKNR